MQTRILFFLILLPFASIFSQNLVPNPSFEKAQNISNRWSGTFSVFNRNTQVWDTPTQSSPDLIFTQVKDKMFPIRPKTDLTKHFPRTGKAMVGIKTFGCHNNNLHCKEYLQIKLNQKVIAGVDYYYEYWVNPLETSVKVNKMGIALSKERVKEIMIVGLLKMENFYQSEEIANAEPNEWIKISGTFKAKEDANFLLIGSFSSDEETSFQVEKDGLDFSYYLIDDVFFKPLNAPKEEILTLKHIYFERDKAELLPKSFAELDKLVARLKENPTQKIEITGHTSDEGSEERNLDLSMERGTAVAQYLIKNGISSKYVNYGGRGSSHPIAPNDTEENRKQNRRVEVRFIAE